MRIFLCFGNAKLCFALGGKIFAKCICKCFRAERNGNIRHFSIILCHADIVEREKTVFPFKTLEIGINKGSCDFSCTVRAEIEENNTVVFLHSAVLSDNGRKHKFVR